MIYEIGTKESELPPNVAANQTVFTETKTVGGVFKHLLDLMTYNMSFYIFCIKYSITTDV